MRAQCQRRGGAEGTAKVRDAAREDARAKYKERTVRQCACLLRQHPAIAAALTERLQRRQALYSVQELLAERLERELPLAGGLASTLVHDGRRDQGEQRGGEHHPGDRHVPERHEGEDGHRRADSDRYLRQILPEEGLQLLDPIDDGQHDAAGTLRPKPCRPEGDDFVVQPPTQRLLYARGGAMRDHRAQMVEPGPQQNSAERRRQWRQQLARWLRAEQAGQELAEKREPGNADSKRQQAEQDAQGDPPAQPTRHPP